MKKFVAVAMLMSGWVSTGAFGSSIMFNPAMYYSSQEHYTDSVRTDISHTWMNITAGYKVTNGVLLGIKYLSNMDESKSTGVWSTTEVSGTGLTVAYVGSNTGVKLGASYLLDGKTTNAALGGTVNEVEYYGGNTFLVDVGYGIGSNRFAIGPQLSYLKMSYLKTKTTFGTTSTTTDLEGTWGDTWVLPHIAVWAEF
jgi:hypothetical protein